MAASKIIPLALSAIVGVSCTLTRKEVTACAKTECLATFGAGFFCGEKGLCERSPVNPRCATTLPTDLLERPENYKDTLLVGVLMDRSVEVQRGREEAITLAARQVNDEQGVDGRRFGLIFCDIDERNPAYEPLKRTEAAVASARFLARIGVPAIIGPSASADAIEVFDAVGREGVLVISPAATSPALTGHDVPEATDEAPGLLWRTAVPDTFQGAAIARHLIEKYPDDKVVSVIHHKDAYGTELAKVFTSSFEGDGSGRTVRPYSFETPSQRDLAIVQAADPPPKFVLFFSSQTSDAIAFLNAAKANEAGSYKDVKLFLTDSAANPDLLAGAERASTVFPRVTGSRPAIPKGPTFDLFKTSFTAAFRKDPGTLAFVPHSYDAAWLVFSGAAWSVRQESSFTGPGIARGLRRLSVPGPEVAIAPGNWGQVLDALGTGGGVNVVGASGNLDYDPKTEETGGLIDIWQIVEGQIRSTATIDPR